MLRLGLIGAITLSLMTTPAVAGPLSKVVGGLKHRSGQDSSSDNSSSSKTRDHRSSSDDSSDSSSDSSDSSSDSSGSGSHSYSRYRYPHSPGFFLSAYPYPTNTQGPDTRLYLGLHSVEASDGAASVSLRASHGDLGLELDDIRYYEQEGEDFVSLDVWTIGLAYRAVASGPDERTAVWIKGGLAGANSDGLGILGAMAGAEVAHNISPSLGVEASARLFAYSDGIRALELRTGVAASIMRVSYRVLKFNVGPALRGPEVGVALSF